MKEKILNTAKNLPFFGMKLLESVTNADNPTLRVTVSRMLEKGELISLKQGVYVTKEYYLKNSDSEKYRELISSVLRKPSYLSTEYVLSKYDILSEAIFGITAVTTKSTRSYSNKLGEYIYKSIKNELFTGYTTEYFGENSYNIATKAKALFDYLYFKISIISEEQIEKTDLIEELRLKMGVFEASELEELRSYSHLTENKKLNRIIENIIRNAHN
jgi:predicted transcriptional regulator of viral defense system